MARIRAIKPGFFKHGDLFDAEQESGLPLRIAYAGLWCIADREGRFKWKPRDIKPDVLPFDNVSMVDVMDALEAKGFLLRYTVEGQEYGWIIAFLVHQHVNKNEPASNIPAPPENIKKHSRTRRAPPSHHEEGKGKEGKGKEGDAGARAPFDCFWEVCPKKVGKGAAEKSFSKALSETSPETLIAQMRRYAASVGDKDPTYTKHPATWLNQKCWLDEGSPGTGPPALRVVMSDEERRAEEENLRKMGVI